MDSTAPAAYVCDESDRKAWHNALPGSIHDALFLEVGYLCFAQVPPTYPENNLLNLSGLGPPYNGAVFTEKGRVRDGATIQGSVVHKWPFRHNSRQTKVAGDLSASVSSPLKNPPNVSDTREQRECDEVDAVAGLKGDRICVSGQQQRRNWRLLCSPQPTGEFFSSAADVGISCFGAAKL